MHQIALIALKELLLATIAKVAWKAVAERFFTRLVIYSLEKLKDLSTNDVVDQTVEDIIDSLRGKRLKVVDELPTNK